MLNHAILTREELETSLNVLLHNGFIIKDNDKFSTTHMARQFYKSNKKLFEGCIEEWIRIAEIFTQQPFILNNNHDIIITEAEYKKALSEYIKNFGISEI